MPINPNESKKPMWSQAEAINWISRSVLEREQNPDPTINDLIQMETDTIQSQEQGGDPNVSTHREVLSILQTFSDEDKRRKVKDVMAGLGVKYKYE